jgi:hypothetical protein
VKKHVFLSGTSTSWGEALLAVRLAKKLIVRGEEVTFVGAASLGPMFRATGIVHDVGGVDQLVEHARDAATVVLCDLTTVLTRLRIDGTDPAILQQLTPPIVAFDVWDLTRTDLRWDHGTREAFDLTSPTFPRITPSPLARPIATPGVFDALPPAIAHDPADTRRSLGLADGGRLVLLAEARWQAVGNQKLAWQHRAALAFPELVGSYLASEPAVRLLHIAPEPSTEYQRALGSRYRWRGQVPPDEFARLVAAADCLLSLNAAATTIGVAAAAGVPVLLGINSYVGGAREVAAALTDAGAPGRTWLAHAAPLEPFRVWPLGLHRFLAPILADNPYAKCFVTVELLEGDAFRSALRRLLFDADARAASAADQRAFVASVRELPDVLAAFDAAAAG